MTVSMKKWGNSLALRVPRDVANTLHLKQDDLLELEIKEGALILRPRPNDRLESLVAGITEENRHHEVETGEPLGHEAW